MKERQLYFVIEVQKRLSCDWLKPINFENEGALRTVALEIL